MCALSLKAAETHLVQIHCVSRSCTGIYHLCLLGSQHSCMMYLMGMGSYGILWVWYLIGPGCIFASLLHKYMSMFLSARMFER